jgi:hypothetical protein
MLVEWNDERKEKRRQETSLAAGRPGGQFDRTGNFGLALHTCVAYEGDSQGRGSS